MRSHGKFPMYVFEFSVLGKTQGETVVSRATANRRKAISTRRRPDATGIQIYEYYDNNIVAIILS